jgi:hypothetical protein
MMKQASRSSLHFLILISLLLSLYSSAVVVIPAGALGFTVSNLDDSGAGSLRQAILSANANALTDFITFTVSGTIFLNSTLPHITGAGGLTIDGTGQNVSISGNDLVQVLFVDGGAMLTLKNLTISDAKTDGGSGGGGVAISAGTLIVENSTFSSNNAGGGSAIYNFGGTVEIAGSTFEGNSTASEGGAIANSGGTMSITNSTFSGNSAYTGGGVYNYHGEVTIINSTISGNGSTLSGGAVYNDGGTITVRNSILANSLSGGNCSDHIVNGGNNIDSGESCAWGSVDGSMSKTDPKLGLLANYGGPTSTFRLLPGSMAIDGITAYVPNGAPATDQRGVSRPQGAGYDIGSYEAQGLSIYLPLVRR